MSPNWYLGFAPAIVYIVGGLLRLPRRCPRFDKYDGEKYDYACKLSWRYSWQLGLLFTALTFMLMRSVRLMTEMGQMIILGILLVVEIAAMWFSYIPVERAVKEKFGEDTDE